MRQTLNSLDIMRSGMVEELKVRLSNLRTLYQLSSTVVAIMLWGCVAASGAGTLYKVDGIRKKEDCLQILQIHLKSSAKWLKLGHRSVFQQENDPKHIKTGFGINKVD